MSVHSRFVPIALAAVLATAAGCGGASRLSRVELIAKADPICRRANDKLRASRIDPQNIPSVGPAIAAADKQASDELGKLVPPSDMEADWKAIVLGWRTAGESLASLGRAIEAKDVIAQREYGAKFSEAQQLRSVTATRNGFDDCAKY